MPRAGGSRRDRTPDGVLLESRLSNEEAAGKIRKLLVPEGQQGALDVTPAWTSGPGVASGELQASSGAAVGRSRRTGGGGATGSGSAPAPEDRGKRPRLFIPMLESPPSPLPGKGGSRDGQPSCAGPSAGAASAVLEPHFGLLGPDPALGDHAAAPQNPRPPTGAAESHGRPEAPGPVPAPEPSAPEPSAPAEPGLASAAAETEPADTAAETGPTDAAAVPEPAEVAAEPEPEGVAAELGPADAAAELGSADAAVEKGPADAAAETETQPLPERPTPSEPAPSALSAGWRDAVVFAVQELKEQTLDHMTQSASASATTLLGIFKSYNPMLDTSLVTVGFNCTSEESAKLVESIQPIVPAFVECLRLSLLSDDSEESPSD
ncbi:uncharacterized protein LOC133905970 [Phragmites australis]|uniref:uncharacterized protein LOC133905970 n=1 Tax=Phragmites australis TaxID=29695 RepID=UPI002D76F8B5|nr:uncharacterized protein LOC133905970 [Phragmites australis]